jgi:hypothetical protein
MRRLLPNSTEVMIFAVLALLCAVVVDRRLAEPDLMLAGLAAPVFLMAAVMGLRRSATWNGPSDLDRADDSAGPTGT